MTQTTLYLEKDGHITCAFTFAAPALAPHLTYAKQVDRVTLFDSDYMRNIYETTMKSLHVNYVLTEAANLEKVAGEKLDAVSLLRLIMITASEVEEAAIRLKLTDAAKFALEADSIDKFIAASRDAALVNEAVMDAFIDLKRVVKNLQLARTSIARPNIPENIAALFARQGIVF